MPDMIFCSALGSDLHGDGTEANPYRTPTHALRPPSAGGPDWISDAVIALQAGDIFPHLECNRNGLSLGRPFAIRPYGEGPPPIMSSINFQNGDLGINNVTLNGIEFRKTTDSNAEAIRMVARGSDFGVISCVVKDPFDKALAIQSGGSGISIQHLNISDNTFSNLTGCGMYIANASFVNIFNNLLTNIGTSMFHQGIYMNANCTDYTIRHNTLNSIANCGIQARSGMHTIEGNLVMNCGYGIATGHGMSTTMGRGCINNNVVLFGRPLNGSPINCGIGVGMTGFDGETPYEVSGNIVAYSNLRGYGGISIGDDNAVEYVNGTNRVRGTKALVHDNFIHKWETSLRLCECNADIGLTRNQISAFGCEALRLTNPSAWNLLGVRPFSDFANVNKVMLMNDWIVNQGGPLINMEMAWMGGLFQVPADWLPFLDPGHSMYPPADYDHILDLRKFTNLSPTATEAEISDALVTKAANEGSPNPIIDWARSEVGY